MAVDFADYINFMLTSSTFKPIAKFELLNPDETVYASFSAEVTGGTLVANRANGVRRTCDLNVTNFYNDFTPNPDTFWVNQKFKLSLGYIINGEDFFIPQGVFGVSNPENIHIKSQKETRIMGTDKFAFLNGQLGGRILYTTEIPSGSNIIASLKASLVESTVNDPIIPLLLINSALTTPYIIIKEYDNNFGDLVLNINNILANNMFYDTIGRFTCEPDIPNSEKGSMWDFRTSSQVYLGATIGYKFDEAYNIVRVVGDNINGNLASGIAINADPSSPLSIWQIGEKVAPIIKSTTISSDNQAQDLADYWVQRYTSLASNAAITCIPLPHLDVDQIITITDSSLQLSEERYLIDNFTIGFTGQGEFTMSIGATNANDLDFDISNILS